MQSVIRARTVVLVLICWAMANALMYCGLEWYESSKLPVKYRPSRQWLVLFKDLLNHSISTAIAKRSALLHRLMSPVKVKSGELYPLVMFLHGAAEKGDDNQTQLLGLPEQMAEASWREQFPCFLLAPQCPTQSYWTSLDDELIGLIREVLKQ